MTQEKEQPVANQYLAIVDSMFTSIVKPVDNNDTLNKIMDMPYSSVERECACEICKIIIPPTEYDENLGVCNPCNARLE